MEFTADLNRDHHHDRIHPFVFQVQMSAATASATPTYIPAIDPALNGEGPPPPSFHLNGLATSSFQPVNGSQQPQHSLEDGPGPSKKRRVSPRDDLPPPPPIPQQPLQTGGMPPSHPSSSGSSPEDGPNGQLASPGGVPRLPPILQVEKQQVTTTATQAASASRRRNEAHFVCPVPGCGSTFTRRFNLRGHLRSHTEERPYVCDWPGCQKGFARQHDCKRHQALHTTKTQTNGCPGCKKTFSRLDALNRHLRSDGGAECRKIKEEKEAMEAEQQQQQSTTASSANGQLAFPPGSTVIAPTGSAFPPIANQGVEGVPA